MRAMKRNACNCLLSNGWVFSRKGLMCNTSHCKQKRQLAVPPPVVTVVREEKKKEEEVEEEEDLEEKDNIDVKLHWQLHYDVLLLRDILKYHCVMYC